jgi:prepilin-type N-terminal cleavage/methylation domain-containing protein
MKQIFHRGDDRRFGAPERTVSPTGSQQGPDNYNAVRFFCAAQIANLGYSRLEICATKGLGFQRFKRSSATRHLSSVRAFTLIEIMVVVAIMAIILAAGLPSIYGLFHKEGLRKTTSEILETCQSARASAILSGSPVDLVFHPREGTCETASAKGGYGSWAHSAKIENCTIEMLDVNLQECKDFDTVKVRFNANGTCDEMTLVLQSNNNEWRKISLDILTGLPSVSDKIQ